MRAALPLLSEYISAHLPRRRAAQSSWSDVIHLRSRTHATNVPNNMCIVSPWVRARHGEPREWLRRLEKTRCLIDAAKSTRYWNGGLCCGCRRPTVSVLLFRKHSLAGPVPHHLPRAQPRSYPLATQRCPSRLHPMLQPLPPYYCCRGHH